MRASEHLIALKQNLISIPQNEAWLANKLAKLSETFEQKYMRKPSVSELAELTGEDENTIKTLLSGLNGFAICYENIDAFCSNDDDYSVENAIYVKDRAREIEHILDFFLCKRCAYIVKSVFGIGNNTKKTLACIAEELGITRERVRQLLVASIKSLQDNEKARSCLLMVA